MDTPHPHTLLTADQAEEREEPSAVLDESAVLGTVNGQVLNEANRRLFLELANLGIRMDDEREVSAYLQEHPSLVPVLGGVCQTARAEFETQATFLLKVYHDPEIQDVFLALFVRLKSYEGGVFKRLEKVRQAHENDLIGLDGSFLVTSDYRTT